MWLRIFDNEKQPYLALSPISHVTNSAQKGLLTRTIALDCVPSTLVRTIPCCFNFLYI